MAGRLEAGGHNEVLVSALPGDPALEAHLLRLQVGVLGWQTPFGGGGGGGGGG